MSANQLASPTSLPSPDERPNADVVIYDGHCRICTAQIRRLASWDWGARLSYLSLHDPRVPHSYPDLTHDALMKEMYVIDRAGRRHAGALALRYLSRRSCTCPAHCPYGAGSTDRSPTAVIVLAKSPIATAAHAICMPSDIINWCVQMLTTRRHFCCSISNVLDHRMLASITVNPKSMFGPMAGQTNRA
jgi:hypothetical protein